MDVGWSFTSVSSCVWCSALDTSLSTAVISPKSVPSTASNWYYFREIHDARANGLDIGRDGAGRGRLHEWHSSTSTVWIGVACLDETSRSPRPSTGTFKRLGCLHGQPPADVALAKGIQHELKVPEVGGSTISPLRDTGTEESFRGGPDQIGDVSWNVPTIVLGYPSNIPNLPVTIGPMRSRWLLPSHTRVLSPERKVQAMTILDLLTNPELIAAARDYFNNRRRIRSTSRLSGLEDHPHVELNAAIYDKRQSAA